MHLTVGQQRDLGRLQREMNTISSEITELKNVREEEPPDVTEMETNLKVTNNSKREREREQRDYCVSVTIPKSPSLCG